jgi:S-adenosylmethionine/arginine decarboxylase-like enzyme
MEINYGKELILDLQGCNTKKFTEKHLRKFLIELCDLIKMQRHGKPMFWNDTTDTPHLKGTSVLQFIKTSNIVIHCLDFPKTTLLNIFSCKDFDLELAKTFSKDFFEAKSFTSTIVDRKITALDNPKVKLQPHTKFEQGVFAKQKIHEGEIVAVYDGKIYAASKASLLPNKEPVKIRNYAMQFEKNKFRDSSGIARYLNHSCNPNCGIKENFKLVTMREVKKGEELTWDYSMSMNSDLVMDCSCGEKNCRKKIKGYDLLPKAIKEKYNQYTSDWLTQ